MINKCDFLKGGVIVVVVGVSMIVILVVVCLSLGGFVGVVSWCVYVGQVFEVDGYEVVLQVVDVVVSE